MRISRLLPCITLILACRNTEEPADQLPTVPVHVARVARGNIEHVVELAGMLEPLPGFDVRLAPSVAGRLTQVLVTDGDRVRAGQLLARLDATPLHDALLQAEAQLEQAKAQASNAATKLSRVVEAFDAGVAARQEVDDATLQDRSARAAVRTAEAAVSTARNQLARAELKAPFDGVVAKVAAAAGEPVDPSKMVVEVARVEVLELRAPVAPKDASLLRPGQRATIESAAQPGERFSGEVSAVNPVVDPATGAALVRIRVSNASGALRANVAGHSRVVVDVHRNTLLVPKAAIVGGPDGPGVEVVTSGKSKRIGVATGYEEGDRIEVLSGIREDQQVIVQGAYGMPEGTLVRPEADPGGDAGTTAGAQERE